MGRPRCDPIDFPATLSALATGSLTPFQAHRLYASTAARPYTRSSWEGMVRAAIRQGEQPGIGQDVDCPSSLADPLLADSDDASDAFWSQHAPVKPQILITTADNASIRVRGKALIVTDMPNILTYEPRGIKPQAIVMCGWSGMVTINALRFCADYGIDIVILDWERDFLTIVSPPSYQSANIIRAQVNADPLPIAKALIRAKIEAHVSVAAVDPSVLLVAIDKLACGTSIGQIFMIEASAAKFAWVDRNIVIQWREAGRVPHSWKLPYSLRRRLSGKTRGAGSRRARNATDPINCLLNLALAVTIGRLTVALVARGFSPSIGFLHKSPTWSLSYDAIEPLRPHVEAAVFDFIGSHKFSPSDFIMVTDGTLKTNRILSAAFLDAVSLPQRAIDGCVDSLASIINP